MVSYSTGSRKINSLFAVDKLVTSFSWRLTTLNGDRTRSAIHIIDKVVVSDVTTSFNCLDAVNSTSRTYTLEGVVENLNCLALR